MDPSLVKARHGNAKVQRCARLCGLGRPSPYACRLLTQAMLTKWTGMLAEAGLRGKHVTFEPAGEAQVGFGESACRVWYVYVSASAGRHRGALRRCARLR